jgi:hypothetical protein
MAHSDRTTAHVARVTRAGGTSTLPLHRVNSNNEIQECSKFKMLDAGRYYADCGVNAKARGLMSSVMPCKKQSFEALFGRRPVIVVLPMVADKHRGRRRSSLLESSVK